MQRNAAGSRDSGTESELYQTKAERSNKTKESEKTKNESKGQKTQSSNTRAETKCKSMKTH